MKQKNLETEINEKKIEAEFSKLQQEATAESKQRIAVWTRRILMRAWEPMISETWRTEAMGKLTSHLTRPYII